jgi:hypothetical protein
MNFYWKKKYNGFNISPEPYGIGRLKRYSCTTCPSGDQLSPIPVSQFIFMDPRLPVYSVRAS